MMDPEYTTVSVPPVDGHLGIFVGQDLWYPLFDSSNIENTVREICGIVGSDARSSSVSKWKLEERPDQEIKAEEVKSPRSLPKQKDKIEVSKAWSILSNVDNILYGKGFSAVCEEWLITSESSLGELSDDLLFSIGSFLKQVPRAEFYRALQLDIAVITKLQVAM